MNGILYRYYPKDKIYDVIKLDIIDATQVNVPLEELQEMRNARIATLINPASTVLDDSIGCAQWFAARGNGNLIGSNEKYISPARVRNRN